MTAVRSMKGFISSGLILLKAFLKAMNMDMRTGGGIMSHF